MSLELIYDLTAKPIYMIIFLGVVIPTLVAFMVDLYVVLPIRFSLHPEVTPKLRVVDCFAKSRSSEWILSPVYLLTCADEWMTP